MHLIIPYAASHKLQGPDVLARMHLPNLHSLLRAMQRPDVWQSGQGRGTHPPHERLLAQALGWPCDAPTLPWAAWHWAQQGQSNQQAQAWMTPCHWQIGMNQVVMADPAHLHLSDDESQQLLHAMQPFFQEDGLQVTWQSALMWHVQGAMLADVACASLDRVIGQNVQDWMPVSSTARSLQRLQSEMQMLLYQHPVNDARDANRQITVNAFWLHGAGRLPVDWSAPAQHTTAPDVLRQSALHGDVLAWRQAWQLLDATALADLLAHWHKTGQAALSLCSEHTAHTYSAAPAAWHHRLTRLFHSPTPAAALTALSTP